MRQSEDSQAEALQLGIDCRSFRSLEGSLTPTVQMTAQSLADIPVQLAEIRAGSLQGLLPGAPTDPDVRVKTHPVLHAVESLSLTRLGRFVVTRWKADKVSGTDRREIHEYNGFRFLSPFPPPCVSRCLVPLVSGGISQGLEAPGY